MHRAFLIALMTVSTGWIANAAAQPVDVASGTDLVAWQTLEHRRLEGDPAVASYRAFIETFGASPLSVAAYGRLVDLDRAEPWSDDVGLRAQVEGLRRHWVSLQAELRTAPTRALATIDLREPNDDATVLVPEAP